MRIMNVQLLETQCFKSIGNGTGFGHRQNVVSRCGGDIFQLKVDRGAPFSSSR